MIFVVVVVIFTASQVEGSFFLQIFSDFSIEKNFKVGKWETHFSPEGKKHFGAGPGRTRGGRSKRIAAGFGPVRPGE